MRLGKNIEDWPIEVRVAWPNQPPAAYVRRAIGRLLGWAAAQGLPAMATTTVVALANRIEEEVSARTAQLYLGGLRYGMMQLQPEIDWSWLQARQRASGRVSKRSRNPQPKPRAPKAHTVSWPASDWPAPYRARWQAACQEGNANDPYGEFTSGGGFLSSQKPRGLKKLEQSWGMLLRFMHQAGNAATITPGLLEAFVADLRSRRVGSRSTASYLGRIAFIAPILSPDIGASWISTEARRFHKLAGKEPSRKDGRVVSGEQLLALGFILCDEARRLSPYHVQTAVLFRDGLMIALLVNMPARITAFSILALGRHLDLTHQPGHVKWRASEVKGRRSQSDRIWPEVRTLIDEYISRYRLPLLDGYQGKRLWLTETGGRPMTPAAIRKRIKKHSLERLGIDVTPHLFRDSVAMTMSERAPEEMEVATLMLHHASEKSTRPYRAQATTIAAADKVQNILRQDRVLQERKVRAARSRVDTAELDPIFARYA